MLCVLSWRAALALATIALALGKAPISPAAAQPSPPPPISPNDFSVSTVPDARTPNVGSYFVYLYIVTTLDPGTKITFKHLSDACTKEEYHQSFEVTSKPYLRNERVFRVPSYNPLEGCFYVASSVRWRVTATHGSKQQHVEIIVAQKPQIPLQQDFSTQCIRGGTLPCTGGQQPATPLPKVVFGKIA